jgi:DNA invertase Pin-like site-specific DNA recombinase
MIIGYLRVSTEKQDTDNQKLAILDYANRENFTVDDWIEITISSKAAIDKRKVLELIESLHRGDGIIVAELSRLGRSVGQIIQICDLLVKNGISLISIKENLRINGKQDMQTKIMITLIGLFAEIERDLISQRTREGLKKARSRGVILGRRKGKGKSKLDGQEELIKSYIAKKINKTSISRLLDCSRTGLLNFIKSRNLEGSES